MNPEEEVPAEQPVADEPEAPRPKPEPKIPLKGGLGGTSGPLFGNPV